jgi:uncharacterized membrane-anchored protein YhcB (DUF1043 family)
MTNMGGRFESHLREAKLESLFGELKELVGEARALEKVNRLAAANGTKVKVGEAEGYEAKVVAATRFGSQRTLDANVAAALADVVSAADLQTWEDVIGKSGTLVARRVWGIFWSNENQGKWVEYLSRTHQITKEQAGLILSRVCYLPASKRKPLDTYWTLTGTNMVHTEFPNHQENVRKMAEESAFRLEDYTESITQHFPDIVLKKLTTIPDFRKGYELSGELSQLLRKVGIDGNFGIGGHTPEQWPEFGSVQKTLAEFKAAYDKFRADMVGLFNAAAGETAKAAKIVKPKNSAAPKAKAAKRPARTAGKTAKKVVKKAPKAAAKKRAARR